jgi:hypothetical protein
MKKVKVKTKAPASDKPSAFLAAGYKVDEYSNGTLLLQKGADLRLFNLTKHRDGADPVHGNVVISFAAKVP